MNIQKKIAFLWAGCLLLLAAACSKAPATPATMAGFWQDNANNVTTIQAKGDGYEATLNYYIFAANSQNTLVSSSYENGVLTWKYCPPAKPCLTMQTVSFHGNTLEVTWTDDTGGSGRMTLTRTDKGKPTDE